MKITVIVTLIKLYCSIEIKSVEIEHRNRL